jgi:hypothetical protein
MKLKAYKKMFNYTTKQWNIIVNHTIIISIITLVQPKLEHASVAWNSIMSMDSSKLQRVKKIAALSYSRFSAGVHCSNYEVL